MAKSIIVGANPQGRAFARALASVDARGRSSRPLRWIRRQPTSAHQLIGFIDDREPPRIDRMLEAPMLGRLDELGDIVRREAVDEVFLSLPVSSSPRIANALAQLRDSTASVHFLPQWPEHSALQVRIHEIAGTRLLTLCGSPFTGTRATLKRFADIMLALVAILLTGPLMLMIALCIRLTMPGGPVLFRQRRHGLNGRTIEVWKFRTMRVIEDGPTVTQATRNDPRITRLGAFLRRTSLDELPQFFNVLQGRMSVIGPRPHALAHNEFYRDRIDGYMLRHKALPGITGLAQISGARGETDTLDKMERRVAYDLQYLREWSPALDARILWRTVVQTVKGDDRAY
ncbi:MAG: undecaprenyl-phosphate glucose phosphotransferase [Burkholderiaceae bacterium]